MSAEEYFKELTLAESYKKEKANNAIYTQRFGADGAAKWASNSWAPCAAHKTINGKEVFYLFFANGGNGICVLTSDSPL